MTDGEIVSMQKYVDIRFDSLKCEMEAKLEAMDKAVSLAAGTMEKRLDSMNEFREALKDAQSRFLTRQEYSIIHDKVIEDVKGLREDRAREQGKASQTQVYAAWLFAAIGIILSAIAIFR